MLLEQSGLLRHIAENEGIKTAIVFGSFSRGDWNRSSDIDLFIYGDDNNFDKGSLKRGQAGKYSFSALRAQRK